MVVQGRGDARRVFVGLDRDAGLDLLGGTLEIDQQVIIGAAIARRREAPVPLDHPALVRLGPAGAHIVRIQIDGAIE
ncbi:hypothetical protein D3C72_2320820 [compost metagenome]